MACRKTCMIPAPFHTGRSGPPQLQSAKRDDRVSADNSVSWL
jgi:hypothetical protein